MDGDAETIGLDPVVFDALAPFWVHHIDVTFMPLRGGGLPMA